MSSRRRGAAKGTALAVALLVLVLLMSLVAGCTAEYSYKQHLVGPYYIRSFDDRDMPGIWRQSAFDNGLYVRRIPPAVVCVGFDERYIVALRSRTLPPQPGDELVYYYLDIAKDGPGGASEGVVVGPLTREEFDAAKEDLGLPEFMFHYRERR